MKTEEARGNRWISVDGNKRNTPCHPGMRGKCNGKQGRSGTQPIILHLCFLPTFHRRWLKNPGRAHLRPLN